MRRPPGVTASAVVCILGSILALFFAALITTSVLTQPSEVFNFRTVGLTIGAIGFGMSVLGIATGIGLLRMRAWARMSTLVFAGLATAVSALSLAMVPFLPFEVSPVEGAPTVTGRVIRVAVGVTYLIPLVIAIAWLIYFNRPATKAAFEAAAGAPIESRRPLSISIMGWSTLVAGVVGLLPVFSPWPAFLFGLMFTGWGAHVVYMLFAAVSIYIGWGLLRLRERARIVALAWCGFSILHAAVMLLVPAARARLRVLETTMSREGAPVHFNQTALVLVPMIAMVALMAVAAWYLVRTRPAFSAGPMSQDA